MCIFDLSVMTKIFWSFEHTLPRDGMNLAMTCKTFLPLYDRTKMTKKFLGQCIFHSSAKNDWDMLEWLRDRRVISNVDEMMGAVEACQYDRAAQVLSRITYEPMDRALMASLKRGIPIDLAKEMSRKRIQRITLVKAKRKFPWFAELFPTPQRVIPGVKEWYLRNEIDKCYPTLTDHQKRMVFDHLMSYPPGSNLPRIRGLAERLGIPVNNLWSETHLMQNK